MYKCICGGRSSNNEFNLTEFADLFLLFSFKEKGIEEKLSYGNVKPVIH